MLLFIPNFRLLIDSTTSDSDSSSNIYVYAVLMFFVSLIQSIFYHQHFDTSYRVGMRIRASVVAVIYKKVWCPLQQLALSSSIYLFFFQCCIHAKYSILKC